jgi:D-3-phosphoglycerate dehydrogenase / 2-oxoglutarate reductase
MTKVLVASEKPFAKIAVEKIKNEVLAAGYEFAVLEKYSDVGQLLAAVGDADALIVRSDLVTPQVFDAAKQLKIVVRAGAGYDTIDVQAATNHHVVVMNTPGQNANAVAELAICMMIYKARSGFIGKSGSELMGKKLGVHGYGNVGMRIASLAKGFNMEVYAYDPYKSQKCIDDEGVICIQRIDALFKTCDYVVLCIPANKDTKLSINFDLLSKMPKPAVLVNMARVEIINEADLLRMFKERTDFAYIADVAPECRVDIETNFPGRFLFTEKKMGAQTEEANTNAGIAAAVQIREFFEKGDTRFQVNK